VIFVFGNREKRRDIWSRKGGEVYGI